LVKQTDALDLDELFEQRVPARKFALYQCVGPQAALHGAGDKRVRVETAELENIPADRDSSI